VAVECIVAEDHGQWLGKVVTVRVLYTVVGQVHSTVRVIVAHWLSEMLCIELLEVVPAPRPLLLVAVELVVPAV